LGPRRAGGCIGGSDHATMYSISQRLRPSPTLAITTGHSLCVNAPSSVANRPIGTIHHSRKVFTLANTQQEACLLHIWEGWIVALPKQARRTHNTWTVRPSAVNWRHALRDLRNHSNFMRWICLECLLETQTHIVSTFVITFFRSTKQWTMFPI
jgi:hypothetical protein